MHFPKSKLQILKWFYFLHTNIHLHFSKRIKFPGSESSAITIAVMKKTLKFSISAWLLLEDFPFGLIFSMFDLNFGIFPCREV